MSREEGCAMDEEIGVLCSGKIFRHSRKRIVAEREGKHSEIEERDIWCNTPNRRNTMHIEEKEKEKDYQLSPVEEDPTQARLCVKPMTPCASPRTEVRSEILSLVVSEGSKDSSKGSQSSGSSTPSQNQLVSPGMNTMQSTMAGVDPTLRMLVFHGAGSEDPEQHLFVCEAIWTVKNVQDDDANIAQLETTFREHALLWYMKYRSTAPVGQTRTLADIRKLC
jgi:hypothetical protein